MAITYIELFEAIEDISEWAIDGFICVLCDGHMADGHEPDCLWVRVHANPEPGLLHGGPVHHA